MKRKIPVAIYVALAGVVIISGAVLPERGEKNITAGTGKAAEGTTEACPVKAGDSEGIKPGGYVDAKIKRVVDGDTVVAEYKGKEYRVRLLCIDTPEMAAEGAREHPFAEEAAKRLEELVIGKTARLVFEKDLWDRYDRLLAYIFCDGACVNALMVGEGLARVEFVRPNVLHEDYFKGLQQRAISERKGMWALPENERPFVEDEDGNYVPRHELEKAA